MINKAVILRLGRRFLLPFKSLIAGHMALSLLAQSIMPIGISLTFGDLTQAVASRSSSRSLVGLFVSWVVLTILSIAVSFSQKYLVAYMDGRIANGIRDEVFDAVMKQSPGFFAKYEGNRLTMIINQFSLQVGMGLRQLMVDPIFQLISVFVAGFTLFSQLQAMNHGTGVQAWFWFLCIVFFALLSPLFITLLGQRLRAATSAVQDQNLALATLVGGAVKAPEEVQAMRAEPFFKRMHAEFLRRALASRMHQTATIERLNILNQAPGVIVLAALIGVGVLLVVSGGTADPGTLVKVAGITPSFMAAIQGVSSFVISLSIAWPSINLINSILEQKPEIAIGDTAAEVGMLRPSLEVRNLVFSFHSKSPRRILDGVSFTVPEGKVCGLVAKMGQGKTTFFRLALRFYDPQEGQILAGGIPTTEMSVASVRRHFVLMAQFPAFFHDTVRENFRIAEPQATDEKIRELSERTHLWLRLVSAYGQDPLNAPFMAGEALSGGQKKLFALTRSLLRDPTFLLLDEPTTGMDPHDKYPLITTMRQACIGKTVLVVDHDILWQSRFCDHFVVLDQGKIVQEGTARQLIAAPGLFRDLYKESCQCMELALSL
jgi:ATP-binding cassette, subfamily B, bacterial